MQKVLKSSGPWWGSKIQQVEYYTMLQICSHSVLVPISWYSPARWWSIPYYLHCCNWHLTVWSITKYNINWVIFCSMYVFRVQTSGKRVRVHLHKKYAITRRPKTGAQDGPSALDIPFLSHITWTPLQHMGLWDFVIFELGNKSWKLGQPPPPQTTILSFITFDHHMVPLADKSSSRDHKKEEFAICSIQILSGSK